MRFLFILLIILLNINRTNAADLSQFVKLEFSPQYERYNYWNEINKNTNNFYKTEYSGFQKLIYSRAKSVANKYYRRTYSDFLEQGNWNYLEFNDKWKEHQQTLDRQEGTKWDRYFWEFYPTEKGGIEITTNYQGEEISIIDTDWISLSNSGKFKILKSLDLNFNQTKNSSEHENIFEYAKTEAKNLNKVSLGLSTPEASFKSYPFELKINIGINLKTDLKSYNDSSLKISGKLILLTRKDDPWLELNIKIQTKPLANEHSCQLFIELLRF